MRRGAAAPLPPGGQYAARDRLHRLPAAFHSIHDAKRENHRIDPPFRDDFCFTKIALLDFSPGKCICPFMITYHPARLLFTVFFRHFSADFRIVVACLICGGQGRILTVYCRQAVNIWQVDIVGNSEDMMERTNLIAARTRRRWTLEQAAEYLQVDTDTLYRWEKGKTKPRAYNIELLCATYGLSAAQLGIVDSSTGADAPDTPMLNESGVTCDEVIAEAVRQDLSLRLIRLVWLWPRGSLRYEELQRQIMNETEQFNSIINDADHPITRRDALRRLALLPVEMSGLAALGALVRTPAEEFLPLCAASITACWYLMGGSDFMLVEHVLPHYLPRLEMLAKQSSKVQKEAARLASHGHQIAYVITSHQEDFSAALTHCRQAYLFGQVAGDMNIQASALVRQGVAFLYRKRPLQTLQSYQQALSAVDQLSPLLRARLYAGLAEVYGKLGQEQEARRSISLAYEHFPEHSQQDVASLYVHFERSSLFLHEGLALLDLHKPADAAQAFAQVDGMAPKLPVSERSRVDFLNQQAMAAAVQNDLEQFSLYIEAAVTSALALGSDLRYSEAWDVYKSALFRWHHEPRMKALGELFVK